MNPCELRLEALKLANAGPSLEATEIVKRAEAYYAFLGGKASAPAEEHDKISGTPDPMVWPEAVDSHLITTGQMTWAVARDRLLAPPSDRELKDAAKEANARRRRAEDARRS